ncbi:hypothetical protein FOF52_06160 [Thermobifida alba]|uniref:Uncharacterized protein n=1 Tax=Thermobifida alba TaxID=53522 RepID=A0ABY4KYS9_THEAE|nr:hypothetical protein [Thermobifida alba]UPT20599.1 hypothetical protein FOF52_06160 [Thermobifida alba]HLU99553.1 hypothetical protein [Thermobifida alba]
MADHAHDRSGELRAVLDAMYSLAEYSAEDRLRALLFGLRAGIAASTTQLWQAARELGAPATVAQAFVDSDIPGLHAALVQAGHGWPMLASLLAYGLDADVEVLAAAQLEYEEIALDSSQRNLLPITPVALSRRGYRLADAATVADPSRHTDPRHISTEEELLQALRCLRASAGNPTWRDMGKRSAVIPAGADRSKHQSRSYNTLRMLVTDPKPSRVKLEVVLAFVRGCGVTDPAVLQAWEDAYRRIAVARQAAAAPQPRFRLRLHDHPTGPQASHS